MGRGKVSPDDRREESPKFACAVGVRLPDEQREEPRRGRKGSSDALAGERRGKKGLKGRKEARRWGTGAKLVDAAQDGGIAGVKSGRGSTLKTTLKTGRRRIGGEDGIGVIWTNPKLDLGFG